ncbi:unnamed protein product [Cercopithifilaria johnstoni]|uniref:Protein CASC3 n=1 Tax=Cercopithifilaria johnstoni TaxID=2874296 RepID=A0A8J2LYJ1_9BILA|nr:unnamed protein product [Cercopithifilaria johnstoni]
MQSSFKVATITTVEARMIMEEDPELMGIAGYFSEMKIIDNEQSRNLEDEIVNICESEYLNTFPQDETTNIQQLERPDDDEEVSEPDEDQDQTHPAYIPRTGQFFMHDTRETSEKITLHPLSRADRKWRHDLYNEDDQIPLSDREFAKKYGVDREGNPVSLVSLHTQYECNFRQIFILKLLQELLFLAFRQDIRGTNPIRIPTAANVWNAPRHFTRTRKIRSHGISGQEKRKSLRKRGNDSRLPLAGDAMNEEHHSDYGNQKLDEGKEAENKTEIDSIGHSAKLEIRIGKRYSTQRPMKSVEK